MLPPVALPDAVLGAWRTNARVTTLLVSRLPLPFWSAQVPGAPRRTVGMIVGHLHNARCMWLTTLGKPHGIPVPPPVDRRSVTRSELVRALRQSSEGIGALLAYGCDCGGRVPATAAYAWRNLALDVGHVLTYLVAHEAHHRGQIVLLARQLGHRLPGTVTNALWQWKPESGRRTTPPRRA